MKKVLAQGFRTADIYEPGTQKVSHHRYGRCRVGSAIIVSIQVFGNKGINHASRFGRLARDGRFGADAANDRRNDFDTIRPIFFTTSNVGGKGRISAGCATAEERKNIDELKAMDVIITCQGGDYTTEIRNCDGWLEWLLDRRCLDTAYGRWRRNHS